MLNNNAALTVFQVREIIDTYEGMLRLKWDAHLLAERTKWCAILARMEGR